MSFLYSSGLFEPAIPDSVVTRYKMDEGTGTTLTDSEGSNDAIIDGASWISGNWVGDNALAFPNAGDRVEIPYISEFDQSSWTILGTVEPKRVPSSTLDVVYDYYANNDYGYRLALESGEWQFNTAFNGGSDSISGGSPATDTRYRVALRYDTGSVRLDVNDALVFDSTVSEFDATGGALDIWLSANQQTPTDFSADTEQDNWMFATEYLSDTEVSADYNDQPWT